MNIELKKFGTILISRPAGKEAFAAAKAYLLPKEAETNEMTIDFAGVEVLSPSWADEFISGLKGFYRNLNIYYVHTDNPSVKETIEILSPAHPA